MRTTQSGERRHLVTVQAPGPPQPDGDGGFIETWNDLVPPQVYARIVPATARDLERTAAGTVIATASHLVTIPYHPQVTVASRIVFGTRILEITGIANRDERNIEQILICAEQIS